ncbi:hypothetical protein [Hyphomonas sp.]|uniref:hypothetical protein n=1 Tax=Hyphomonas sp. TaxID=87 RepID=UPI00391B847A
MGVEINWGFPESLSIWEFLNSPIATNTIFPVMGFVLLLVFNRNAQANRDQQQIILTQQQFSEPESAETAAATELVVNRQLPQAPVTEDDQRRLFNRGSASIARLKQYVDSLAENAPDGRRHRKYSNVPRHDYRPIVQMIVDDKSSKELTKEKAEKSIDAFSLWRPYQTGKRHLSDAIVQEIESFVDAVVPAT